ncbi:M16 family metallopeptidase [Paramuribaculum intestinale]|uniref:M16 family metallopeptidase n=1 Tax=Paramuribaculum intestinale TaxID=2094151 RepID=UPI0025B63C53|nr:pitrilysin family protein [Paramuribaculum intestinale]
MTTHHKSERNPVAISHMTLPTGLRLLHIPLAGNVEYFGMAVRAGSRDEMPGEEGLAHFVEHTIFKGTIHRKACHIVNCLESVGGELNAFTTKEETNVYSVFPKGNLRRAAGLIADLVTDSVFPAQQLDKERSVVEDEINSYLDSPSEAVYDDFDELIFAGSPLAHNILGSCDTLATFTPEKCRQWLERHFTIDSSIVFYAGSERPEKVIRTVSGAFERFTRRSNGADTPIPAATAAPFIIDRGSSRHQAHTLSGVITASLYDNSRFALSLLSNIIGGPGMNSLLNVELRERRGLVYTVESSLALYSDCGLLTVYFGCDPDNHARCLDVMRRALGRLSSDGLSERKFRQAQRQLSGQTVISSEQRENAVMSAARSFLLRGEVMTTDDCRKAIESITPDDFRQVLKLIDPERLSTLTLH